MAALVRWAGRPSALSDPAAARDPADLAERELERLRWRTASLQTSTKWALPLAKASYERADARSLEERELSHPDAVAAFRDFARRYGSMPGARQLVVTVDELDKIGDVDKAAEMINSAKDLLHIDRTHFVVSVSEEALAGYALRGMSVRDVFDSAFDVVLDVKPLTASESLALLEGRVLDFPVPVGLLCHSVAGGLPRDLVRSARQCVGLRRASNGAVSVPALADALTRRQLSSALDAAIRLGSSGARSPEIFRLREQVDAGAALTRATVAPLLNGDESGSTGALGVFATFLGTTCDYFSAPRDRAEWQKVIADGSALKCAGVLASVQRTIPISPSAAAASLVAARRLCGLDPL